MTSTDLRLEGIEPDNVLAFLALLGLLRAIEHERTALAPRVAWAGLPLRPVIRVAAEITTRQMAEIAEQGCFALGSRQAVGAYKDISFDGAIARTLLQDAARGDGDVATLSALMTDGARKQDGGVIPTPLCLMFGQGHQHFLERLAAVPTGRATGAAAKRAANLRDPASIERALFAPWQRGDATDGFRWDPADDRRYALRFGDPSSEASTTEHGANRLAAVALPLFTVLPARRFGRQALAVRGFTFEHQATAFTWPLWEQFAGLATIVAMLDHPELAQRQPHLKSLGHLSIVDVRRSRRISVGKFLNFTRAESVAVA
jgi:hypothetical protein